MKGKEVTFVLLVTVVVLSLVSKATGNFDQFYQLRGRLIFQEEFNTLNKSRWQHVITAWRGGNNEFEYYTDRPENRYNKNLVSFDPIIIINDFVLSSYVRDGILYIRPTLTADRFAEDFLYNGTLDMWKEGCNVNYNGGCVAYAKEIFTYFFILLYDKFLFSYQDFQRRHHQSHSIRTDAHY